MTACTERRPPAADNGQEREGQGMPKEGPAMTACTERRPPTADNGQGMPKEVRR
jgi:hypothetical protein